MKRCPQCLFLFPDSDSKCDFDQTPLEHVDDSAIESTTRPPKRRTLPIAAAIGLMIGVLVFAVYYGLSRQQQKASTATETSVTVEPVTAPPATPSPSPEVSPSPSPHLRSHHLHNHQQKNQPRPTHAPRATRYQRVDQEWEPARAVNP